MKLFQISRGWLSVRAFYCFAVHLLAAVVVAGRDSTKGVSLFARGVYSGTDVLVADGSQSGRRLLVGANGKEWRDLAFTGSENSPPQTVSILSDGTWLIQSKDLLWISRDQGGSWSIPASAPSVIVKSDPVALAELSRLGAIKLDKGSAKVESNWVDGVAIESFMSVSIISPKSAVAAVKFIGKYGPETFALVKTDDAGSHWKWHVREGGFIFDESGNFLAHHIFFISEEIGWISSDYLDDIFSTKDGGRAWKRLRAPDRVVSAIYFKNSLEGRIIGGSTARIYDTADGGSSWHELTDGQVDASYFGEYFGSVPSGRWNDFAVYRFVLGKTLE